MRTLVIIPTYNEKENITTVIEKVLTLGDSIDILVIDDNSPDGTGNLVESLSIQHIGRVDLIKRPQKMGLGSAYVTGFKHGLGKGYDFLIEMDADLSHNPEDIKRFLALVKEYDLVIGSRYTNGVSVVNWPITRLILSYLANFYARVVTGIPIRDLTAGFTCFRREVIASLELDRILSDGYAFQIEVKFRAYKKGFRLLEIPIIFEERGAGTSKMSKRIIFEAFFIVWRLRWQALWKKIK